MPNARLNWSLCHSIQWEIAKLWAHLCSSMDVDTELVSLSRGQHEVTIVETKSCKKTPSFIFNPSFYLFNGCHFHLCNIAPSSYSPIHRRNSLLYLCLSQTWAFQCPPCQLANSYSSSKVATGVPSLIMSAHLYTHLWVQWHTMASCCPFHCHPNYPNTIHMIITYKSWYCFTPS